MSETPLEKYCCNRTKLEDLRDADYLCEGCLALCEVCTDTKNQWTRKRCALCHEVKDVLPRDACGCLDAGFKHFITKIKAAQIAMKREQSAE